MPSKARAILGSFARRESMAVSGVGGSIRRDCGWLLGLPACTEARCAPRPTGCTPSTHLPPTFKLWGSMDVDAEQPLLQRLAADEDDDSSGDLVHLYRQFVLSDQTAAAICASALNDAVFAVRNPDVSEAVIEDAAREENAADLAERRHDVEDDVMQPAAAFDLQEAILDAQNQVIQSHLPFDLHALILTSLVSLLISQPIFNLLLGSPRRRPHQHRHC